MSAFHPKKNNKGQSVAINQPSKSTSVDAWLSPDDVAVVVPGGALPDELNEVAFAEWADCPVTSQQWERIDRQAAIDEPVFTSTPGKADAAGVVVQEADGRFWLVAPTNQFGGYQWTFPKGKLESGMGRKTCAIKEALEESGLKVEITGFLLDADRSTTRTRYYLARRVGGSPASMGWESQAVALVPRAKLSEYLTHPNDKPLLEAIEGVGRAATLGMIFKTSSPMSANRVLRTVAAYHKRYGIWPKRLFMEAGMTKGLTEDVLTPLGWAMLALKMELIPFEKGTLIAEGSDGRRFDYADMETILPLDVKNAGEWIWGINLGE